MRNIQLPWWEAFLTIEALRWHLRHKIDPHKHVEIMLEGGAKFAGSVHQGFIIGGYSYDGSDVEQGKEHLRRVVVAYWTHKTRTGK